jgi:glycosyltransferase involved in cell wall biosynthesis
VYVSASLLEGFGLPLAEALACGTPVAATAVGSVAEVVGPGGILTAPHQPTALAQSITRLLDDPAYRRQLGQSGRQHIAQNFSLQNMIDSTLAAYQHFLTKPLSK